MQETKDLKNNYRVVSLFSGGGGLDLGFKQAGYELLWAIDNNKDAVNSYRRNVDENIILGDVTQVDLSAIPHPDVVVGGPPCQSFSLAGNRHCDDARGRLVWRYLEIIKALSPKAFLFENVAGLISAKDSDGNSILEGLLQKFGELGYNVSWNLVNTADYGVPQIRKRVIIVGLKSGKFIFPETTHNQGGTEGKKKWISVEEAIGDLPVAGSSNAISEHEHPTMSKLDQYICDHVKPGGNYMDIPNEVQSVRIKRLKRDGGHTTCYGRMLPEKPSYTINTYFNRPNVGCNIHYKYNRIITLREAMRLQTFPDDYEFVSTSKQGKHLIVGNAVPPKLANVLAKQLLNHLKLDSPNTSKERKSTMWLRNTDKEVECFHPVCGEALTSALKALRIDDKYEVQHHRYVGSIEMDLVVANKSNNKILCVVEVKRTIAAVNSTRYQYQAMSYVQSLRDAELESKYYILTNLEASCLFKFDTSRPNVFEQIIDPGIQVNHLFADVSRENFMEDLTEQYKEYLQTILNDNGKYLLTFKSFANEVSDKLGKDLAWKKALVCLFYEYIRGSFSKIGRNGLKTIPQLSNKVDLICKEGSNINFKDIFNLTNLGAHDKNVETSKNLLQQLFELGKTYVDADELASVMHKVISNGHEHEGEVSTDPELANLMLWLVKSVGGEIESNQKLMDPAAGSGSLLCAATNVFSDITPSQLVANDVNKNLLQLLSLRIGLKFASTIDKTKTAEITTLNISEMPTSAFDGVKYIVMNPPYLAATGRNCTERKAELYRRIREIKGIEATTSSKGQMPLEGVFVELVSTLAKEGTIIAAILPNTHFTTKGNASVAIRKMLLEDFGLQMIFNYPQENLFNDVIQNTSIVIGIKGTRTDNVRYLYCNETVTEVDTRSISYVLAMPFSEEGLANINNDFEGCLLSRQYLNGTVDDGWQIGNMSKQEAIGFIDNYLETSEFLTKLSKSEYNDYKRGKIGNSGCTDLLYLKAKDPFLASAKRLLQSHLSPGLNNAKFNRINVGDGESYFFDVRNMSDDVIKKVIKQFLKEKESKAKKQRQDNKTLADYLDTLKKESERISKAYSVMLPRSIRSEGRVFVSTKPTFVSTNFFVIQSDSERAKILSSWLSTIFYQLECEVYGNNRKGLRKMEKEDYEPLHVPVTDALSEEQKMRIEGTMFDRFVNLRSPKPREIDKVWANIIFGEEAEERLEEATTLLAILVANREK